MLRQFVQKQSATLDIVQRRLSNDETHVALICCGTSCISTNRMTHCLTSAKVQLPASHCLHLHPTIPSHSHCHYRLVREILRRVASGFSSVAPKSYRDTRVAVLGTTLGLGATSDLMRLGRWVTSTPAPAEVDDGRVAPVPMPSISSSARARCSTFPMRLMTKHGPRVQRSQLRIVQTRV